MTSIKKAVGLILALVPPQKGVDETMAPSSASPSEVGVPATAARSDDNKNLKKRLVSSSPFDAPKTGG